MKVAQGHKCCTIEWSNGIEGIEHWAHINVVGSSLVQRVLNREFCSREIWGFYSELNMLQLGVVEASWPCPIGTCLRERKFLTQVIENWVYKWPFSMKDQYIHLFLWKVRDVWPAYHLNAGKGPREETSENNELLFGFQLSASSCVILGFVVLQVQYEVERSFALLRRVLFALAFMNPRQWGGLGPLGLLHHGKNFCSKGKNLVCLIKNHATETYGGLVEFFARYCLQN